MANSPARSAIDVGSVIADTYTIEAMIGRGGMGAVFLASHNRLPGKQVAIKVLHTDADDPEILIRFRREAEIASRLGHPNIVAVSDYNVTAEGMPYLVLEYLIGETLAQRIKAGPMALEPTLRIARQVGSALAAAHRAGIVHRDLKPQNIFLVPMEIDGSIIEIAKVLDFGISKIRGSETVKTQESSLLGTPQYMAPEQATGQHTLVDERTDIFALGAIIYEMLTGHPAFSGASIPEVVFKVVYEQPKELADEAPTLPKNVIDAVHTAMQKGAADRFGTVGGFVEALTGQSLVGIKIPTIPPPEAGFAGGSKISRNNKELATDAFANTMGSGDHGASPLVTGIEATIAPSPSVKQPSIAKTNAPAAQATAQATIESQRMGVEATIASSSASGRTPAVVPIGPSGVQAPLEPTPTPTPPPPPHKKPMLMMAVLAVVCVGAAIVAVVFATRGGGDTKAVAPKDAAPAIAAVVITADAAPPAIDAPSQPAATPLDAAPAAPAKPDAAPVAGPRHDAAPKAPPAAGDPEVEVLLTRAEGLVKSDPNTAEQLANQVISSESRSPDQSGHALAIRAKSNCVRFNEEGARNSLRTAPARWRKHALDFCHAIGQLPDDK